MTEIDSRSWTGPAPEPPIDRGSAHAAFRPTGGAATARCRRGVLGGAGAAAGRGAARGRQSKLAPGPTGGGRRCPDQAGRLAGPVSRAKGADGIAALLGDPRLLALLLALAGSFTGMASAWRHRAALARGFRAAGGTLHTSRFGSAAPLVLLLSALRPVDGTH